MRRQDDPAATPTPAPPARVSGWDRLGNFLFVFLLALLLVWLLGYRNARRRRGRLPAAAATPTRTPEREAPPMPPMPPNQQPDDPDEELRAPGRARMRHPDLPDAVGVDEQGPAFEASREGLEEGEGGQLDYSAAPLEGDHRPRHGAGAPERRPP
jgi:hypothetical protein